ncbi:MAG: ATP-binding cassette domain-containing protein, partial [Candidatus Dormibacteraeota bacterium]|nr:ATP-binding cassette domain-containing protein [Candidatus Dormibacteraeota bacterium]
MIELQSVSHRYPDGSCALRRLDLSVERGTLLGITGSNGSGKSTLLRHLNGLLRPTAGRVLINGSDAAGRTVAALSRTVGLAFQEPADQLFQSTVLAEVTAGSASPERARLTLELVGLSARG